MALNLASACLAALVMMHPVAAQTDVPPAAVTEQRFADLGDCVLESGTVIHDCRIGYRVLGTASANRDNVILVPTWLGGTSEHFIKGHLTGDNPVIDSSRYQVVVVDAFGNGVSTSPSNSKRQPGAQFPPMSLRDMVRMQARLLVEHLKVEQLHAVLGVSMGGMQAFEWAVTYPDRMRKIVSIAGTPRLATFDVVLWQTRLDIYAAARACQCTAPFSALSGTRMILDGPAVLEGKDSPAERQQALQRMAQATAMSDAAMHDSALQLKAMIGLDIGAHFGGMEGAAKRIQAKLLIVTAARDHIVTPGPARAFAKLAGAEYLESPQCGHQIPLCDANTLRPAIRAFLDR